MAKGNNEDDFMTHGYRLFFSLSYNIFVKDILMYYLITSIKSLKSTQFKQTLNTLITN